MVYQLKPNQDDTVKEDKRVIFISSIEREEAMTARECRLNIARFQSKIDILNVHLTEIEKLI